MVIPGGVAGGEFSKGGIIGRCDKDDIDLGSEVVVVVVAGGGSTSGAFIDFGRPQTFDSVVLTNLSFGLLGSHICNFSSGDTAVVVGEVGDGDGEVGKGNAGGAEEEEEGDVCCPCSSSCA
jgi:hypothetical protein